MSNGTQQYYIDGLVIYANDLDVWRKVGRQNTTGNPNYAIAYKSPVLHAAFTSNVLGVNWAISQVWSVQASGFNRHCKHRRCGWKIRRDTMPYIFENKIGEGADYKCNSLWWSNSKDIGSIISCNVKCNGTNENKAIAMSLLRQPTRFNESK